MALQSPPQQCNDRNLTPKQKLRGYPPDSQKMMRTSFMDCCANTISKQKACAYHSAARWTNALAMSLLWLCSACELVVGVVIADLGQIEPQIECT